MGRNKRYVEARLPYEIPCYGVFVHYDKAVMDKLLSKDEKDVELVKQHLAKIIAPTKGKESVLGVNNGPDGVLVLIPVKDDGSDKIAVQQIIEDYGRLGFHAQLGDRYVLADGRYLDGIYKGFLIALPKHEIEVEVRRILDKYCHEWHVTQDPKLGMLYYEGDLGGRTVTICVQNGDWQMSAGLSGANMYYTREVSKHWKDLLLGLEGDITSWAKDHPGVAKA